MTLEDLGGKLMMLDGIDFLNITKYQDSQVCNFRLDGIVYSAIEDPEDGWRSAMKEIILTENKSMMNTFKPITIFTNYIGSDCMDILELIDVQSKKPILSIGTNYTDNYYPFFVANFIPSNMLVNSDVSA